MKLSLIATFRTVSFVAVVTLAGAVPALASAESTADATSVTCVAGQFGDHVEQGRPAGDSGAVFGAKKAVYWVDMANTGDATQVTLVWSLDGHEVQRQTLDVGRAPHWHTWGMRPIGDARKVDVEVLDAAGHSLKTDTLDASSRDAG